MLEVASEEYRLWEARLATTAKYQKTLVLTIHYAVGLPSADQNGFSDPYCQIGEWNIATNLEHYVNNLWK